MSDFLVLQPLRPVSVIASRGSGAANLLTKDPKEVWADSASGSNATLTIDLGAEFDVDTVFLGYVAPPAAAAAWAITGYTAANSEIPMLSPSTLRVPDVADTFPATTHALWRGAAQRVRYVVLSLDQPAGAAPLRVGALAIGRAFTPTLGQEWGLGRQPIDTGTATALSSGGFAVVEGARKRLLTWTFGDLSIEEADRLELIALELGQTSPAVVIEDARRTAGLRARCHYGLFRWRAFDRRNRAQTRWEMELEEWI